MDCSPPGFSVHGISQGRILEWVAISFSKDSSWPRDRTCISCLAGGFFTIEPPGKPQGIKKIIPKDQWFPALPAHENHLENCFFFFKSIFFKLKCNWFKMLYWFLLYSKVVQLYMHIYTLFKKYFSRCGLSWDIEYSSLCYRAEPCCLSVLHIIASMCWPHIPTPFLLQPSPLATTSLFSMPMSLFLFHR